MDRLRQVTFWSAVILLGYLIRINRAARFSCLNEDGVAVDWFALLLLIITNCFIPLSPSGLLCTSCRTSTSIRTVTFSKDSATFIWTAEILHGLLGRRQSTAVSAQSVALSANSFRPRVTQYVYFFKLCKCSRPIM
jgi:hypothetical protein